MNCHVFFDHASRMNRASDKVVAQVSNLLYRRLPACGCAEGSGATVRATLCRLEIGDTAGWKPALRGTGRTLSVALGRQRLPAHKIAGSEKLKAETPKNL